MSTLFNKWFILFALIWIIIYSSNQLGFYFYWPIQSFALDLIVVPILANLGLWLLRIIYKNNNTKLSYWHLLYLIVSLSLVFEYYLPQQKKRYTQDYWDILMYVVGALFFLLKMNTQKTMVQKNNQLNQ
jgi:hypothetical protein